MNNGEPSTYQSYMLRLWRDHPQAPWQASLQSTATEQLHHFADLEQLWAFLMAQLQVEPGAALAPVETKPHVPD